MAVFASEIEENSSPNAIPLKLTNLRCQHCISVCDKVLKQPHTAYGLYNTETGTLHVHTNIIDEVGVVIPYMHLLEMYHYREFVPKKIVVENLATEDVHFRTNGNNIEGKEPERRNYLLLRKRNRSGERTTQFSVFERYNEFLSMERVEEAPMDIVLLGATNDYIESLSRELDGAGIAHIYHDGFLGVAERYLSRETKIKIGELKRYPLEHKLR